MAKMKRSQSDPKGELDEVRELRRRLTRLETIAGALGIIALGYGIGGASLWFKLQAGHRQAAALDSSLVALETRVAPIEALLGRGPALLDSAAAVAVTSIRNEVVDGAAMIKHHTIAARTSIDSHAAATRSTLLANLSEAALGYPERKSLDQWHQAPAHGFLIVAVGGSGGNQIQVHGWVNDRPDRAANHRTTISGYTSELMIVRKGQYFRVEKEGRDGVGTAIWVPLGSASERL